MNLEDASIGIHYKELRRRERRVLNTDQNMDSYVVVKELQILRVHVEKVSLTEDAKIVVDWRVLEGFVAGSLSEEEGVGAVIAHGDEMYVSRELCERLADAGYGFLLEG